MRERPLCTFCLLFLMFQVIFIRGFQLGKDWKPSLLEQNVEEGSVMTLSGKAYHKEIKKDNLVVFLTTKKYQTKVLVYIKQNNPDNKDVCIGNEIEVTGEVAYFDEPRNPGNFDQKFYYQKQGIHGSIFASKYSVTDKRQNIWNRWKEQLARVRIRWKDILIQVLGEDDGNTMSAILLGDKSELDSDLKELYQKNGIGHILAISGLHMTFIGLGFYKILRKRGFSFASAGIIGIVFLISYTMMIGNGVASMRALVMFIVRIGADITGRVYDMLTSLALAAIVILVWRPLYLYDAGFLLSFGAILGVLLIYPMIPIEHRKDGGFRQKIKERLLEGIWGSISINLAILPCMLYFYFEFPPYSIFVNLLVIPLMSVVLGTGVIGSVICIIIPGVGLLLGEKILWICKPVLWIYERVCELCLHMPGSRLVMGQPEMWQMILYYLILIVFFGLVTRTKKKRRRSIWFGMACVFAISIVCVNWHSIIFEHDNISVTMLDVGQGDGLVIRNTNGFTCMVDGGSSDVKEVGKYRIEPYLKSQGIGVLDYVFVSHGDLDHYSGIEEMLQRQKFGVRIRCLVLPVKEVLDDKLLALAQTAAKNGTIVVTIKPEKSVFADGMSITCLQPGADYNAEIGNASSMVLSLSYGGFDMLFTGDVEGDGEEILRKNIEEWMQQNEIQYEVLKVAHHGSKNSSSSEILSIIHPRVSLISAGIDNRYGHPHQETIERIEDTGSSVLSTQQCGAITVSSDGSTFTFTRKIEYNER